MLFNRFFGLVIVTLMLAFTWFYLEQVTSSNRHPQSTAKSTSPLQTSTLSPQVTGLFYQTSSGLSGFTQNGQFHYADRDSVTFFLGTPENNFPLGTSLVQQDLSLLSLSSSAQRSNLLLRLLASLDQDKSNRAELALNPEDLANTELFDALRNSNWQMAESELAGIALATIEQASTYLDTEPTPSFADTVVLKPLDKVMRDTSVKLRDQMGNLCFYDLDKHQQPDYAGPMSQVIYKITQEGIYEYPSKGDRFGSRDGSVASCDLNLHRNLTQTKFEPIESFAGFTGIMPCARNGCQLSDLSGFVIDEFETKYRTKAFSFDPDTQIVMTTSKGLGPKEGLRYSNYAEFVTFTYEQALEKEIEFNGLWLETLYNANGSISQRCLKIESPNIYHAEMTEERCEADLFSSYQDVSHEFLDMWWLSSSSSKGKLEQLNARVKWQNTAGEAQYTSWEYLPAGKDWQQGVLHRLLQQGNKNSDGKLQLKTVQIAEYKSISG